VDAGARADVVHADGTVAAVPNEIKSHLQQFLFGFTCLFHALPSWSEYPKRRDLQRLIDQSTFIRKNIELFLRDRF
jgi:hypothetical protein